MPQSLSRIIIHLVFSTKRREPLIPNSHREELHRYVAGILRNEKCPPISVGGVEDHIHLLFGLARTTAIAQVVETVKTSSSKWAKTKIGNAGFSWQNGYGAFSVGNEEIDVVARYILNQEDHHRALSYQEEYRELLKRYGVDFDESYVWE